MSDTAASEPPQPTVPSASSSTSSSTSTESQELSPEESVMWASLAHLGGVTGVIPALVIWMAFGKRSEFTETQSREAVNFQLTGLISWVALFIVTSFAVMVWRDFAIFVSPLLYFALWTVLAALSIVGFLTSKRGTAYRYPVALRIFR